MAPAPDPIRVLLCDDHAVVRDGLERVLENAEQIEVVGTAADGQEGLEVALDTRPHVILMDVSMPRLDGIAATRAILAELPDTRIIMLTSFSETQRVLDAIDAGAVGYVLKDSDGAEVVRAVRAAAIGDSPLDPRAARAVLMRRAAPKAMLTPRERDVLSLLASGLSNKVIAIRLGISEATVKAHLTRVYQQIGVSDRTQAALWARDHETDR
jgi:DNA-binding NarL/FixJ family response regulator